MTLPLYIKYEKQSFLNVVSDRKRGIRITTTHNIIVHLSSPLRILWFRCEVSAPYEQMFFLLSKSELSPVERDDRSHAKTPLSTIKKIHICEPCMFVFENLHAFPVAVGNNRKPPEI